MIRTYADFFLAGPVRFRAKTGVDKCPIVELFSESTDFENRNTVSSVRLYVADGMTPSQIRSLGESMQRAGDYLVRFVDEGGEG